MGIIGKGSTFLVPTVLPAVFLMLRVTYYLPLIRLIGGFR